MKKLLIILMALTLVLSGCQTNNKEEEDTSSPDQTSQEDTQDEQEDVDEPDEQVTDDENTDEVADEEDNEPEIQTVMENFRALLIPEYDAAYIGLFIEEHISEVSPEEADEMLYWLYIYQTELISNLNDKMYGMDYSYANNFGDAMYDIMGGQLDADKLDQVEDDDVREDLSKMISAYLRVVRYEETMVIETDWERMANYAEYTTEDFGRMLNIRGDYMSYGFWDDYYSNCELVVMLEEMIPEVEDPFIRWHLDEVHGFIISNLLIGPEGSHIGIFFDDDYYTYYMDLYDDLIAFSSDYADTSFGAFIQSLDSINWNEDWSEFADYVHAYDYQEDTIFQWSIENVGSDENTYELLVLASDTKPEVAQAVNASIEMVISELMTYVEDVDSYNLFMYLSHGDQQYASISMSMSFTNESGEFMYIDKNLNFDMDTGEVINLDSFLGVKEEELLDVLEDITGITYSMVPSMEIYGQSVNLRTDQEDPSDVRYTQLTLKDLAPYMDLMTFFN